MEVVFLLVGGLMRVPGRVVSTARTKLKVGGSRSMELVAETGPPQAQDVHLARRAAGGDTSAFEELYRRHFRRVYALCLRMTGNATEAEDLTQEVFIQLLEKVGSFRGESAFTTWLHRMTINRVLMHFRSRNVRLEQTTEGGETPEQIVRGTENHGSMPVIDRLALERAIAQLAPGYRAVFVLHDIEGFEHREIAGLLGTTEGTSKSQLHHARLKLRQLLRRGAGPPQDRQEEG